MLKFLILVISVIEFPHSTSSTCRHDNTRKLIKKLLQANNVVLFHFIRSLIKLKSRDLPISLSPNKLSLSASCLIDTKIGMQGRSLCEGRLKIMQVGRGRKSMLT